ncbi:hypothetical protein SAMN06297144_0336 [Sphingomonas guangdongensis]|uniref:GDSL-like Lipase/Acylhydrolase family protein n=1 Tax=Sphingomonas guangdongensis TaxID=1141890 RepID=A0A285QB18_9SPHN|nr:hypothetical protein SAMN06297144_0336 [Sphingomonas guangdongensis]
MRYGAAAAGLVLTGCGDSGNSPAGAISAPPPAPTPTPAPTPAPSPAPTPPPVATSLRPTSTTQGIHNESIGAANVQVGATTTHIHYEDVADGLEFWWWPGRATSGEGEIGPAATVTARASVTWVSRDGVTTTTQLQAVGGGTTASASAATDFLKFTAAIRPRVGSRLIVTFWGNFPAGGVYAHGKADYASGDRLQYGANVPDQTASGAMYRNIWEGGFDYFGPCFIGGRGARPTFVNDGDSQEAGVLSAGRPGDIADNGYGAHGAWGRVLAPYLAGINISVAGATAREMADPARTVVRDTLARLCQVRVYGLGVNDIIFQGRTSDEVAADEATRAARLGLRTLVKTINPVLAGATDNRPFNPARDVERIRENVRRRSLPGTYDIAAVVESGTSGATVNLGFYNDDTHNSAAGNKAPIPTYDVPANIGGVTLVPLAV